MKTTIVILITLLVSMGNISGQQMDKALMTKITRLTDSFDEIPEERKQSLDEVALAIEKYKNLNPKANIIFICTHNSRRSQLSELWLNTAAFYYAIPDISTYSGGTEATAFNPRMVDAIKRFGFDLRTLVEGENPKYQLYLQGKTIGSPMYSKKYDDSFNPQSEFIAVMVCSDADRNCPIVQGAVERVSLPFEDPKASDNTPREEEAYDNKVEEIGRSILYVASKLSESNH